MDEHIEDGIPFSIPDFWKSSTLANLDERADSITLGALGFEPLSTPFIRDP